jgi:uncharacterized membrane protein YkoI
MNVATTVAAAVGIFAFGAGASSTCAKTAKEMAAFGQARISLQEAIRIAQQEVPGGWVIDADIAVVRGQGTYTIEVVKDGLSAVRIDLENGRILETLPKRVPPKDWRPMAAAEGAGVNILDAIAIAEKSFPGARAVSADLKIRQGSVRWGVNIKDNGLLLVDVDLQNGAVLKVLQRLSPGGEAGRQNVEIGASH